MASPYACREAVEKSGARRITPAASFHGFHKILQMRGQLVVIFPPKANVQIVALAKDPGIAFEIPAKPEFGRVSPGFAGSCLFVSHFEFDFLGRHNGFMASRAISDQPGYRAEVSAGTDQQRS